MTNKGEIRRARKTLYALGFRLSRYAWSMIDSDGSMVAVNDAALPEINALRIKDSDLKFIFKPHELKIDTMEFIGFKGHAMCGFGTFR